MDKLQYIKNEVNPITGISFDSAMWLLEAYEQKLVENQDLTVLCRGLGNENEQLRERNEELLKICNRRAKKIFKLEEVLKEEAEENEMLRDALSITDNNKEKTDQLIDKYTKLYFEQLNKVFNVNKEEK